MKRNIDIDNYLSNFNENEDEFNNTSILSSSYLDNNDNQKQFKSFGLKQGEDIFTIPKIKDRVIPREDGLIWTKNEETQIKNGLKELPYGREYYDEQEERLKILNENPDYIFIKLVAGALVKDPQELFEEEDISRILRERQKERYNYELEKKRRIVGSDEKDKQLQVLTSRSGSILGKLNKLKSDNIPSREFVRVLNNLIDKEGNTKEGGYSLFGLLKLKDDYDLISYDDDDLNALFLSELKTTVKHFNIDGIILIKGSVIDNMSYDETKNLIEFSLYYRDSLNLVFDNPYDEPLHLTFFEYIQKRLDYIQLHIYEKLFNNDSIKGDDIINSIQLLFSEQQNNEFKGLMSNLYKIESNLRYNKGRIDYKKYTDENMINLNYIEGVFNETQIKRFIDITINSIKEEGYNQEMKNKIKDLINIENIDQFLTQNIPKFINEYIFYGYPEYLQKLISITLKVNRNKEKIDGNNFITLIDIFKSHFLWIYFDKTSFDGIILNEIDEKGFKIINNQLKVTKSIIESTIKLYHYILSYYIQRIGIFLTQQFDAPSTLIQVPISLSLLIEEPYRIDLFENLKDKTQQMHIDLKDHIMDKEFYNYIQKKSPFNSNYNIDREYLIIWLYFIFMKYNSYIQFYIDNLSNELNEVEEAIKKTKSIILSIAKESRNDLEEDKRNEYIQRKSFTSQPINSGIVKLKPFIVTFIDNAYSLVQHYCPRLNGLPLIEIERSIDSGLAGEFARFVALLISDNSLLHPDQYKSKMQFDKTALNKPNIMNNLKQYYFTKSFTGYKVFGPFNSKNVSSFPPMIGGTRIGIF
jgi:hypothetical protein